MYITALESDTFQGNAGFIRNIENKSIQ